MSSLLSRGNVIFPSARDEVVYFFIWNWFVSKVDKHLMTRLFSKNNYFSEYRVIEHFRFPRLLQLLLFSPSCSILNWWRTESVPQHCFPGRVWSNLQVTSQGGTSERWMGGETDRERAQEEEYSCESTCSADSRDKQISRTWRNNVDEQVLSF